MRLAPFAPALLLASVAAQPCAQFHTGGLGWPGLVGVRWGGVFVTGLYVEFVLYAGGIAAVVVNDEFRLWRPSTSPVVRTDTYWPSCGPLVIKGWAWMHQVRSPNEVDIALIGWINGGTNLWRSPLRDVRAEPAGFLTHPGIPVDPQLGGTDLRFLILDSAGWRASSADFTAILVVPHSGSW